jgi:hypothetical protein
MKTVVLHGRLLFQQLLQMNSGPAWQASVSTVTTNEQSGPAWQASVSAVTTNEQNGPAWKAPVSVVTTNEQWSCMAGSCFSRSDEANDYEHDFKFRILSCD